LAAPLPLLTPEAANSTKLRYEVSKYFGWWKRAKTVSLEGAGQVFPSNLPVSDVASASSAFLGGICLSSTYTAAVGAVHSKFVPWLALGSKAAIKEGAEFRRGEELFNKMNSFTVNEKTLNRFADETVVASADGGYTDNTGIAFAVAAGATEITAFANTAFGKKDESWSNLFSDDVVRYNMFGIPELRFPIFNESVAFADAQDASFSSLVLPEAARHLKGIRTGVVRATTADSKWFGIPAGRTITMRIVSVTSDLFIGGLNNFKDYNAFVQEIVDCLVSPENEAVVLGILPSVS